MQALGLIETKGLVAAIEAADSALKAADVSLMGRKLSSGTEAVWRERLVRFDSGDLTVAEFCRREGVPNPSFYQWRKRLGQHQRQRNPTGKPGVSVFRSALRA